ncbi:hypothetical protein PHYSODRAFT_338436 [Phytophthora sojae]|uniref:ABC transporter family G domain-containing protein n=1 Tax=Phytophthora sojae (strain P6497) TaxID=1094619 RepID=G5A4S6_PHYSP|nr:hypothetical protein PHYSODRAFT_338436 [Phytophthora sojae]EGZ09676.1 hypothetical protein PHYSODRAFT_338436 [Phytophthora sojae]|eukprot:XP_009534537.1 hypothetical protein PHYSODRAFT_338436 [Phytophthora sojae]
MDSHSEAASTYEVLMFSSKLRLPPNFTEEKCMRLLELTLIGGEMTETSFVEQKKRVTVGVEVLEPDRLARTVLCTIHQPSMSCCELFDGLLLLQKGGYTAYFGDLGDDSAKMLEYFA